MFTVSRAGTELSTYADVTDGDGRIAAQVDGATPSGRLDVRIDLYDLTGLLVDSETTQVVLDQFVLTTPASLSTRAGTVFAPGLSATLSDKRGGVAGVPVTFTIVASAVPGRRSREA